MNDEFSEEYEAPLCEWCEANEAVGINAEGMVLCEWCLEEFSSN